MADYAKFTARALYSRNSDYSDPEQDTKTLQMALTPDEARHGIQDIGTSAVTILAINTFTSTAINTCQLIVKNNSATAAEFVTIGYTDTEANANSVVVPAGGVAVIPDIDNSTASGAAITLTAASGTPECEYLVVGT
jgi:hypothetical protein